MGIAASLFNATCRTAEGVAQLTSAIKDSGASGDALLAKRGADWGKGFLDHEAQ